MKKRMKTILLLILAMSLIIMQWGCQNNKEEKNSSSSNSASEEKTEDEVEEETKDSEENKEPEEEQESDDSGQSEEAEEPKENESEQEVENKPDINEMDYYQETLNSYSNSGQDSLYALYDLDSDGIEELIVSTGTCEADWRNDVYTIENDTVKSMGSFENTATLYKENDGNGIYAIYQHMDAEVVRQITKDGRQLGITVLSDGTESSEEIYDSNKNEIPWNETATLTTVTADSEEAVTPEERKEFFRGRADYYTNFNTYLIVKISVWEDSEEYDGELLVAKETRQDPDYGAASSYYLRYDSNETATIIDAKKGVVVERGTIEFYNGSIYINWDTGTLTGEYTEGRP